MDEAIWIQDGKRIPVTAVGIQSMFPGMNLSCLEFRCPRCGQDLITAAMNSKKQAPHFRHARGNEAARRCELFVHAAETTSAYQCVSLPLFIRKARSSEDLFIVEGGFKSVDPDRLRQLEQEGAELIIGARSYRINRQRFSEGLTKLPFDELSLNFRSLVKLRNSSIGIDELWQPPENAIGVAVFTRDPDTKQGKRLRTGDTVAYGSNLYLLAPKAEEGAIRHAFPDYKPVGYAGSRSPDSRMQVYEVRLPEQPDDILLCAFYLKNWGFEVTETKSEPDLVWPPSIQSDGRATPLFSKSNCIFISRQDSSQNPGLFIHSEADSTGHLHTESLRPTSDSTTGFAIVEDKSPLSLISKDRWAGSALMLVRPETSVMHALPDCQTHQPVVDVSKSSVRVRASSPCIVESLSEGGSRQRARIDNPDNPEASVARTTRLLLRVSRKLHGSNDHLVVYEQRFENVLPRKENERRPNGEGARSLVEMQAPFDVSFAKARATNSASSRLYGNDRQRAMIRKASR